jgi:hypothetical protein
MHWRVKELSAILPETNWLPGLEARVVYDRVSTFLSREHYGLNTALIQNRERVRVDATITDWLSARIPRECSLLLVFGSQETCRVSGSRFHDYWQDLFCPSRDDVVILSEHGDWILFYHHEDQFEFANF